MDGVLSPLLTPDQAADLLQVPKSTLAVWRCTQRVQLEYLKVGGHVRYRLEDIERFLSEQQHRGGASKQAAERPRPRIVGTAPTQGLRYPGYAVMKARVDEYMSTHSCPTCAHCGQPVESIDASIVTAAEAPTLRLPESSDLHCICAECNVLADEGRVSGSVR